MGKPKIIRKNWIVALSIILGILIVCSILYDPQPENVYSLNIGCDADEVEIDHSTNQIICHKNITVIIDG